ncbi:RagB/SusD family nutrient uptake outer membrane protein [Sphingobacterium bambusae]|uniref:RagB/SusD family nutrient uptake outer membrane protein n=1 Tax=Sphingobacterium bambusae TaxID=662858 RepID=A0ABW6BHL0_9SPHI|nr:RagB/SusD family nutrient uptake outer membrane protein [Sphingobacterium bambusae]WPL49435.1 RagB/SusD family nutrient uptake outer membrane protein [Sphingobacterium bambusae]
MNKFYIKIVFVFGFFITTVLFTACNKWLDAQPQTQLPRAELFQTEEGFSLAMTGAYSGLTDQSLYGRALTYGTLDAMAGYYDLGSYARRYITDAYRDGIWRGLYKQIAEINSVLEVIDQQKHVFSEDNYTVIKGEAIGLRAFLHFDLLRIYGPGILVEGAKEKLSIPFVDALSVNIKPLLTMEQAANRIIDELEQAVVLLEKDPMKTGVFPNAVLAPGPANTGDKDFVLPPSFNRKYTFNYYAALATLARVHLWMGNKEEALRYAKMVIAVQEERFPWILLSKHLVEPLASIDGTKRDRTFATEHIFALNIRALETTVPNDLSSSSSGSGSNLLYMNAAVLNDMFSDGGDARYRSLMRQYSEQSYFPTKLYQDASTASYFKHQMPIIRISEMYYIAAECEPNYEDGLVLLNKVAGSRGRTSPITASNAAEIRIQLQKEYQREFINEGQTWYFFKRYNYEVIPNLPVDRDPYIFSLPIEEIEAGGR